MDVLTALIEYTFWGLYVWPRRMHASSGECFQSSGVSTILYLFGRLMCPKWILGYLLSFRADIPKQCSAEQKLKVRRSQEFMMATSRRWKWLTDQSMFGSPGENATELCNIGIGVP